MVGFYDIIHCLIFDGGSPMKNLEPISNFLFSVYDIYVSLKHTPRNDKLEKLLHDIL